jgi:hypothetical protein
VDGGTRCDRDLGEGVGLEGREQDARVDLAGRCGRGGLQLEVPADLVLEGRAHAQQLQSVLPGRGGDEGLEHLPALVCQVREGECAQIQW